MRAKYSHLYLIIAAVVICSIAGHMVINTLWKDLRIINQPLHTAIEAIGATIAIFMTSLLQNKKKKGEYSGKFFLFAMGFLGMGLLEGFDSVSMPGKGFILLYSSAGLVGSLWFSLIWLPGLASDKDANWRISAPWIVAGCCVLFSIWTMTARETLPAMIQDGRFTPSVIAINLLAGVLFAAAAVRLMIDFHYSQKHEFIVLAGMSMVFGLAELTFPLSALWDLNWWFRHIFHLIAYALVLGFVIYEHRHTEELLHQSEKKLRDITLSTGEGIVGLDMDGNHTFVNPAAAEMLGYRVEELLGKNSHSVFHHTKADGSPYPEDDCPVYASLKDGTIHHIRDEVFWRKDDTRFHAAYTNTPIMDDGKITGAVLMFRDITERKRAEEMISEQRMILEHIVEHSLAGYWDWRKKEGIEYFSPTFKKMLGYEDYELPDTAETWKRLIVPEDLPGVKEVFRKHVESRGKYPYYNEVRYRHKNGSAVWVIYTGTVIEWDGDGLPVRMIGCHVDITRRKNLEIEIQMAHDELERRVEERTLELSNLNDQLKTEIEMRKRVEYALQKSHEELEEKVKERTAELITANTQLVDEVYARKQIEKELGKVNLALRTLGRCNEALVHATDEQTFLNDICRIIIEEGKYLMVWIGYPQQDEERRVVSFAHAGHEAGYVSVIKVTWEDNEWGRGPTGTAIRTGKTRVLNNLFKDPDFAPWREEAASRGYASIIGLPLMHGEKCFGALTIYSRETDSFIEDESILLKELADNVAFGIIALRTLEKNRLAEEELRIYHERLRNLAAHLQSIREEERTLIAREIHDELGQSLTALKFNMSWMEGELTKLDGTFSDKLKTDIEMVNAIIHSVKRICTELRPGILDHLGLGPAIEWQAQEFQKRSGIECRFFIDTDGINVSADMETALFRIFQESLTNILRHANATRVNVSLTGKGDKIILKIADNGIGITVEQLSKPNSFGLLGMRERMYPWAGEVSIQGKPNKGTEITVVAPAAPLL